MMYRLPRADQTTILPDDFVCKETQRTYNQTIGSPALSARANDTIFLMYQENGHVTKLDSSHPSSGLTVIFGTSTPSKADKFQAITSGAESNNTIGLRRAVGFDDGHCFEDNNSIVALDRKQKPHRPQLEIEGSNLWCGRDIRLPEELTPGSAYTLYWVWYFSGFEHEEAYTTCLDIEIIG